MTEPVIFDVFESAMPDFTLESANPVAEVFTAAEISSAGCPAS